MQIIQGTTEFKLQEKSAVAIGKFDGIHLGHKKLLQCIMDQKEQGLQAVVFTFDPAPSVFFQRSDGKELMTREEKRTAFTEIGIDILIEYPLTRESAGIEPEAFIEEVLAGKLNASYIAAGTDLAFGAGGRGNARLLQSMQEIYHYEAELIDKVCYYGREVSSSYIRREILTGHMEEAQKLLGQSYFVTGIVQYGNQLGRTIGMPTVNLLPEENKLLPPKGVYFSETMIKGKKWDSITNIGYKPTVSSEPVLGVETYLYDFNEEVYGEKITVFLLSHWREERRFSGKEELKKVLESDVLKGKEYHSKRKNYHAKNEC